MKDNYQKELLKVLEELKVDEKKGLTTQEVKKRQERRKKGGIKKIHCVY